MKPEVRKVELGECDLCERQDTVIAAVRMACDGCCLYYCEECLKRLKARIEQAMVDISVGLP